jgi:hypothetical protein
MSKAKEVMKLLDEELWSGDVKTKWKPPEDLFAKGSAKKIAEVVGGASKSLKQAVSRVNFYKNRAGDNLDPERKKVLDNALELLSKQFEKK